MKVSVNLITWNGKKYLPYCLDAIGKQTFKDFSLLILDNGSTDGTMEFLKNFKFQIANYKIVFNDKNAGFAAGHNKALHMSDSEYVLVLNQDIILEPNFLEVIVNFLDTHPGVGAVTGKLLQWNFEKNKKTNIIDSCGLKIFKNHRIVELGAGEADDKKWNTSREVFGVSGAAPVYRRTALEDVASSGEFFDKDFFSYKEDIDLAYRLCLFGWKSWFLPEAVAYHDRTARGSGEKNIDTARQRKSKSIFVNYHSYKNHLFFLFKNVPAGIWWRYGYRIKWYEFKKLIYLLFFERQTLKAWGEFFKKLPVMRKKRKWIMRHKKIGVKEIKQWLS